MRIVQLIDSLEPGGAERMAVNFANSFSRNIDFSGLIVTRTEGSLRNQIQTRVNYLFLDRKNKIDCKALFKFRKFIKKNKIQIIQAHSSSYFFACLVKLIYPKVIIVWHDHFGNRYTTKQKHLILKVCSFLFSSIFCVNKDLVEGAQKKLYCKDVSFLPNFAVKPSESINNTTVLKGTNGKRIVCLANLKKPKNHLFLIESFNESQVSKEGWSLHLIGKDYSDSYSKKLKEYIDKNNLNDMIFLYGSCNDISNILDQSTIGVLASTYEGFPVTLLEYGLANLAVISTNVGFCIELINHQETGLLFSPFDKKQLIDSLNKLIDNNLLIKNFGTCFYEKIISNYSEKEVVKSILGKYKMLIFN